MIDFDTLTNYVSAIVVELLPVVTTEGWTDKSDKDWTPEQVKALNTFMHFTDDLFNDKLARQYNRTIWNGHKSGKVAKTLEPLRAETVRKSGTAEAPSAEAIVAAALAKASGVKA